MNATNAGVTPGPGFTYANALLFYSRDQLRGSDGELLATGKQYVLMDLNTLVWVSDKKLSFLGDAVPSASATLPFANNSLTSDAQGNISGGGGLADSYYQPLILAWREPRADVRTVFGFLAPTGRFKAGASNNVGSGYWTPTISAGETFYLTADKATALSAFQMYEFHGHQQGTNIRPGETLDLDYSLTQLLPLHEKLQLQLGIVGYNQWQTTAKTGPTVTPAQAMARYRVNALGLAANIVLPVQNVSVGFKYFTEFANRSTFQGYSLQLAAALNF